MCLEIFPSEHDCAPNPAQMPMLMWLQVFGIVRVKAERGLKIKSKEVQTAYIRVAGRSKGQAPRPACAGCEPKCGRKPEPAVDWNCKPRSFANFESRAHAKKATSKRKKMLLCNFPS
jgi:hypothetical protein